MVTALSAGVRSLSDWIVGWLPQLAGGVFNRSGVQPLPVRFQCRIHRLNRTTSAHSSALISHLSLSVAMHVPWQRFSLKML